MTQYVPYDEEAAAAAHPTDPLDDLVASAFDESGQYVPVEERGLGGDLWDDDALELDGEDQLEDDGSPGFSNVEELSDWFHGLSKGEQVDWIESLSDEQAKAIVDTHLREQVDSRVQPLLESHVETIDRLRAERAASAESRQAEQAWQQEREQAENETHARELAAFYARKAGIPNTDLDRMLGTANKAVLEAAAKYRDAGYGPEETAAALEQEGVIEQALEGAAEWAHYRSVADHALQILGKL